MLHILDEKTGDNIMSSPKLRKVSRNIAKSHLADYNKMNKVSYYYIMKLKASQYLSSIPKEY